MKKILHLAFFFTVLNCLVSIISFAQTAVTYGSVSGTWTLAGSPYLIQGNIMIPQDSTLVIQPGVTINFQGHYKIFALGRLIAVGTISDT